MMNDKDKTDDKILFEEPTDTGEESAVEEARVMEEAAEETDEEGNIRAVLPPETVEMIAGEMARPSAAEEPRAPAEETEITAEQEAAIQEMEAVLQEMEAACQEMEKVPEEARSQICDALARKWNDVNQKLVEKAKMTQMTMGDLLHKRWGGEGLIKLVKLWILRNWLSTLFRFFPQLSSSAGLDCLYQIRILAEKIIPPLINNENNKMELERQLREADQATAIWKQKAVEWHQRVLALQQELGRLKKRK